MSNHTFTPGQRVSDTGKNITGTVADDPAMVTEYPGMIPVHWDNGDRSVASPSILAPATVPSIRDVSDADLEAEATRRGLESQLPAGFTSELFMDCSSEFGDDCEPFGECNHGREYLFIGPEYYDNETGWWVTTQWSPDRGIFHTVGHAGDGIWTPEELDALTDAIATVKREIGRATAMAHVRKNPHLLSDKATVTELCTESIKLGLFASDIMHAVVTVRDEAGK